MRSLLLVLFVASGCVTSTPPNPQDDPQGEDRTIEGTVTAVNFDPMSYDADGEVTVEVEGEAVRVLLPARYNLCAADYDDWADLAVGDAVAVRGAVTLRGAVRPCEHTEHFFHIR